MASRQRERRRCLEVLGVQEDATDDDIRKAYRRMALIFHPDKNENEDANEKFKEISYAYKYLTEGPSAVGFEEDGHFSGHTAGGHDIPIEVLIRLFPWMTGDFGVARPSPFGGLFGQHFSPSPFHHSPFQHFFMDPFSGMRGFDDDEEEIVFIENGRVTVIKTGNSNRNHGKRGNKYGQRRRNNDPFQSSSSPFHVRQNQHSQHSNHSHSHQSHSHMPKYDNVYSQNRHSSGCFNSQTSNDSYTPRSGSNNKNTSHSKNKTAYTSSTTNNKSFSYQTPSSTQNYSAHTNDNTTSYTTEAELEDLLNDVTKEKNKSSTKNKPPTVITSRKERKKMKKASKAANQEKSSVNQGKTTEANQEEKNEPVDTVSEDESINLDDFEDFDSTQVPLKLNKKQRRKLKRERERIEKEMAQSSSGSYRVAPDVYSFTQEVRDDDEMSTTSSTTYDTDCSNADSKSRRARKKEKKKQKQDFDSTQNPSPSTQYDNLFPSSEKDEEEMIRIAMEMSKMEMNPDDTEGQETSHVKSKNERHFNDEGHISPIQGQNKDSNSWHDDIGTSPFYKSPMEDMKKTYYKDMSSSRFDPGSYYKPSQSTGFRSSENNHQSNKDNFARSSNNHRKSSGSKPCDHETRYFYSNNYNHGDEIDGASYKSPIERHEQKYFKTVPHKQKVKHSFDPDELDDVPLNLNNSNSRGVQNGSFSMGEVLNGSLNVPKGIHVKHANNMYDRK